MQRPLVGDEAHTLLNVVMCSINIGHIIACYYTTRLVL